MSKSSSSKKSTSKNGGACEWLKDLFSCKSCCEVNVDNVSEIKGELTLGHKENVGYKENIDHKETNGKKVENQRIVHKERNTETHQDIIINLNVSGDSLDLAKIIENVSNGSGSPKSHHYNKLGTHINNKHNKKIDIPKHKISLDSVKEVNTSEYTQTMVGLSNSIEVDQH